MFFPLGKKKLGLLWTLSLPRGMPDRRTTFPRLATVACILVAVANLVLSSDSNVLTRWLSGGRPAAEGPELPWRVRVCKFSVKCCAAFYRCVASAMIKRKRLAHVHSLTPKASCMHTLRRLCVAFAIAKAGFLGTCTFTHTERVTAYLYGASVYL